MRTRQTLVLTHEHGYVSHVCRSGAGGPPWAHVTPFEVHTVRGMQRRKRSECFAVSTPSFILLERETLNAGGSRGARGSARSLGVVAEPEERSRLSAPQGSVLHTPPSVLVCGLRIQSQASVQKKNEEESIGPTGFSQGIAQGSQGPGR